LPTKFELLLRALGFEELPYLCAEILIMHSGRTSIEGNFALRGHPTPEIIHNLDIPHGKFWLEFESPGFIFPFAATMDGACPVVSPLPCVNIQTKVLDATHSCILCIADIRDRLSALNDWHITTGV
jgi:hypothetical protein